MVVCIFCDEYDGCYSLWEYADGKIIQLYFKLLEMDIH